MCEFRVNLIKCTEGDHFFLGYATFFCESRTHDENSSAALWGYRTTLITVTAAESSGRKANISPMHRMVSNRPRMKPRKSGTQRWACNFQVIDENPPKVSSWLKLNTELNRSVLKQTVNRWCRRLICIWGSDNFVLCKLDMTAFCKLLERALARGCSY